MGIIRGKLSTDREVVPKRIVFGEPFLTKCKCGKWKNIKTNQHVEVKEISLAEFLKDECPNE